jgi:DNA-binding transcriptional MocR family regulator
MWMPNVSRFTARKQLALVDALREDIRSGQLVPGTKLPTQRDLARSTGVAVGTIARAYRDANTEGLIRSTVGRGSFVARQSDTFLQATNAAGKGRILEFRVDYPISALNPDLGPVLSEIAAQEARHLLDYTSHKGDLTYRQAGVAWLKMCGVERQPEDLVLTAGAQHALTVSLSSIAQSGQVVLAEELSYPGLKETADMLGISLVAVAMDDEGIIPDALEAVMYEHRNAVALYTCPTIQNPTAVLTPQHRRAQIAALIERHGLMIIEDDIQRLCVEEAPEPYAQLLPHRTFYICSLSKMVCGGLRIAYLAPPQSRIRVVLRRILATNWFTAPLMAEVARRWIEDGTAETTLIARRKEARLRQIIAKEILGDYGVKHQDTNLYGWIELPAGWTSREFLSAAMDAGVALLGEATFRVSGEGGRPGVRYCLGVAENHQQIREGLSIIATILKQGPGYCDAVV